MKRRQENPVPLWIINITSLGVLLSSSLYIMQTYASQRALDIVNAQAAAIRTLPSPSALPRNPFEDIRLKATSAIVYDVNHNNVVYGLNEEMQLPLASLTKMMTALVASEHIPPYTSVEIVTRRTERDPKLKVGERWPLSDLLNYTLLTSSNTAADSIAATGAAVIDGKGTEERDGDSTTESFISHMNKKAQELGLEQTYFLNPTGLDSSNQISGAYGSAKDIAALLSHIVKTKPYLLETTQKDSAHFTGPDGRTFSATNTNSSVGTVPGLIASKTGLTDLAGGNLAVAFDVAIGEPFIVVVLNSSGTERFTDVSTLIQSTIRFLGASLERPSPKDEPATL